MNRTVQEEIAVSPSSSVAVKDELKNSPSSTVKDETLSKLTTQDESSKTNVMITSTVEQHKDAANESCQNGNHSHNLLENKTGGNQVDDENSEIRRYDHENQSPKRKMIVVDYQPPTSTSMLDKESKATTKRPRLSMKERMFLKHKKMSPKSSSAEYSDISSDEIVSSSSSNEHDVKAIIANTRKRKKDTESEVYQPAKKIMEDRAASAREKLSKKGMIGKRTYRKSVKIEADYGSLWYPIPRQYLLITGAKKDTMVILDKCSNKDPVTKHTVFRLLTANSSFNRTLAGTCFKKLFNMIIPQSQIHDVADLQARIVLGFCYVHKGDMIKKRIKEMGSLEQGLQYTAADMLMAVNGLSPFKMNASTLPNKLQRTIEHSFRHRLSENCQSKLDYLIKKRNLVIIPDADTDYDQTISYEIKYKNNESKMYIYSVESDYAVIEEQLFESPISIDLVRGDNSNFDIRFELNRFRIVSSLEEKPFKIKSTPDQGIVQFGHECLKMKKKYFKNIESIKKVITKRYESSTKTVNKTVKNPLWDSCIYNNKEIEEYSDYDAHQQAFKNKNNYVEAYFELNAEDWYQPKNGELRSSIAGDFYKLGAEIAAVWKDAESDFLTEC